MEKKRIYGGQIFVSEKPHFISTILGSCVSVCIFDKEKKYGGMNHYVLPEYSGDGFPLLKYGKNAIEKLIAIMLAKGSNISNLKAKIIGGAGLFGDNHLLGVGGLNIEIARNTLNKFKIKIEEMNIGGNMGREVVFDNFTGSTNVKFLEPMISEFEFSTN